MNHYEFIIIHSCTTFNLFNYYVMLLYYVKNDIFKGEHLHSTQISSVYFNLFPERSECIQRKSSAESLIFSADVINVAPFQAASHVIGTSSLEQRKRQTTGKRQTSCNSAVKILLLLKNKTDMQGRQFFFFFCLRHYVDTSANDSGSKFLV